MLIHCRTSQMKWSAEHDIMLGREMLLFELWKFKAGSRERGNCLDRISESLNQLTTPQFNVSQKSIRDRLKILEREFKKKERFEKNASGISPEKTEIDDIMEDYLQRREEQEKETEKTYSDSREKAAKDKVVAEDMRNKAMERLAETKVRAGDDPPRKKRKQSANETLEFLREASDKECELKKEELELKRKQDQNATVQQNQMFQQQQDMTRQFQTMFQMFMQQQQQTQASILELLKKGN